MKGFSSLCVHAVTTSSKCEYKKARSFYAAGFVFLCDLRVRVLLSALPWQPIDGGLLPRRGFLTVYTVGTPQTPLPICSSVFHTANHVTSR
nr:MAG TPA: hypothetical protein [Caudoviricetes sp.]